MNWLLCEPRIWYGSHIQLIDSYVNQEFNTYSHVQLVYSLCESGIWYGFSCTISWLLCESCIWYGFSCTISWFFFLVDSCASQKFYTYFHIQLVYSVWIRNLIRILMYNQLVTVRVWHLIRILMYNNWFLEWRKGRCHWQQQR